MYLYVMSLWNHRCKRMNERDICSTSKHETGWSDQDQLERQRVTRRNNVSHLALLQFFQEACHKEVGS